MLQYVMEMPPVVPVGPKSHLIGPSHDGPEVPRASHESLWDPRLKPLELEWVLNPRQIPGFVILIAKFLPLLAQLWP